MTADNPQVFSLVVEPVKNVLVFLVVLIASLAVAIPLPLPSRHHLSTRALLVAKVAVQDAKAVV